MFFRVRKFLFIEFKLEFVKNDRVLEICSPVFFFGGVGIKIVTND